MPCDVVVSAIAWAEFCASANFATCQDPAPAPAVMTPAELAQELRLAERSLRRHQQAGHIGPAHHATLGGYDRQEVMRWIRAGRPPRDVWRELNSTIGESLRRESAAQNNGRRVSRRP